MGKALHGLAIVVGCLLAAVASNNFVKDKIATDTELQIPLTVQAVIASKVNLKDNRMGGELEWDRPKETTCRVPQSSG